jgi:diacylglycerol kinase (ATP)
MPYIFQQDCTLNHSTQLIYNPTAGKGSAGHKLPSIQALLAEHHIEYELHQTERPGHAQELARQAAEVGCDLVVAAGGDGTVNEVINGLMLARENGTKLPALGVLPVGRGNDFAFGADIPTDIPGAVEVLAQGLRRTIDIGHVSGGDYPQGRYFGNGVGLGFDTVVGFEAAKIQWLQGSASYLVALVRTIFLYAKAPVYEITLDDGKAEQRAYLLVSVMNGKRMGGAFYMAPDGNPADGMFNLCLAGQVPQLKILPLAAKFLSGTQAGHPAVKMTQARTVTIRAVQGSIPAHADGETICTAGQSLRIEIHPAALEVVSKSA